MPQLPNRDPRNYLSTLHRSNLLSVEEVVCHAPGKGPRDISHSERFHIVMPLSGGFRYDEGKHSFFLGANHMVLVHSSAEFRVSHPIGGDRSLVLTPKPLAIEEPDGAPGPLAKGTEVLLVRPEVRLAACLLVHAAAQGADSLTMDELTIELCSKIIGNQRLERKEMLPGRGRTLARAEEYLHANFREPISLAAAAQAVGVTPVYLTQLFKRATGMPLHQYLISLRLNEALPRLARSDDITQLALDVGFSSHSHFTAAFRARFATTPSSVRIRKGHPTVPTFPRRPLCAARGGSPDDG